MNPPTLPTFAEIALMAVLAFIVNASIMFMVIRWIFRVNKIVTLLESIQKDLEKIKHDNANPVTRADVYNLIRRPAHGVPLPACPAENKNIGFKAGQA